MNKTIIVCIVGFFLVLSMSFVSAKSNVCKADVNSDNIVNTGDLIFIRNKLNQNVSVGDNAKADVNQDGRINIQDLILVRNYLNQNCIKLEGKIAFSSNRDGNWEIYVMNADGSEQKRITFNSIDDKEPDWSPDGSKIAFSSNRDGNWEIYVMNADGSEQRRITTSNNIFDTVNEHTYDYSINPSWSPDGSRLAFTAGYQDIDIRISNIFVIDLSNDMIDQQVTFMFNVDYFPVEKLDTSPSWSPDGSKLVYDSGGTFIRIKGMPVDIFDEGTLVLDLWNAFHNIYRLNDRVRWSPTGDYILYSSNSYNGNIYILPIDRNEGNLIGEPIWVTHGFDASYH